MTAIIYFFVSVHFMFMYLSAYNLCAQVHAGAISGQKRASHSLKLEFLVVGSHDVDAGHENRVFHKSTTSLKPSL